MALALSSAACGGGSDTPTSPTTSTPTVVDTYNGTIAIGGTATHAFPTSSGGTISILIESLGPVSTQAVGTGRGCVGRHVLHPGAVHQRARRRA